MCLNYGNAQVAISNEIIYIVIFMILYFSITWFTYRYVASPYGSYLHVHV